MTNEEIEKSKWGKRHLHLLMIGQLIREASILYEMNLVCFYYHRNAEEQRKLFDKGRSRCDGVKKRSKHQDWRAHDLCVVEGRGKWIGFGDKPLTKKQAEQYEFLGLIWEAYHPRNKWGGATDVFHFQSF